MTVNTITIHELVVRRHDAVQCVGEHGDQQQAPGQEVLGGRSGRIQEIGRRGGQEAADYHLSLKGPKSVLARNGQY